MERKSSITRNKEQEQVYLSLLNEHFETVSLEKYNDAMMNLIFSEACDKVLGKSFAKKRVSKRKEKKIKELVVDRIHRKYGKWVNLVNFKLKSPFHIQFQTNLDRVFTVTDHGRLFGANYRSACGNIFYTEHCLQRFEDRININIYDFIMGRIKAIAGSYPTTVDVLSMMIMGSKFEYGKKDNHYHLNIVSGILVLEDFGDVFIAKTFLAPDMIKPVQWHKPDINVELMKSFAEVLKAPCERIDNPTQQIEKKEEVL